jgi:hypothetical protein
VKARYVDKWKRHDRKEEEPPWVVTMTLSDASTPDGYLGKRVGATALGFELRDVPHYIKRKMQGHIRRWHNATENDDKKRKGSGQTPQRGKRGTYNAARAMGGGPGAGAGGTRSKWGQMPSGGWTQEQQEQ